MKRTSFTNILRQRRLMRKLARRAAPHGGTQSWTYRDHCCTVNFDEARGVYFGMISGIEHAHPLSAASVDELRTAFHRAVDDCLAMDLTDGDAPNNHSAI